MRKTVDLNGTDWEFGSVAQKPFGDVNDIAEVKDWTAALVPGDVRLDLLRAGKITDPFWGKNNDDSQWVDTRDWWYRRNVNVDLGLEDRAFLILDGVDYQSAVFVDGVQLGRHVGMFSPQVYELPRGLEKGGASREIAVRVWGSGALPKMRLSPAQAIWRRIITPLFTATVPPFGDRYATLKCQMQFGWDFAPRLLTSGIWDSVSIVIARSVLIRDIWLRTMEVDGQGHSTQIRADIRLDSDSDRDVRLVVRASGRNFESPVQTYTFDLHLAPGEQTSQCTFVLPDIYLWNPWDRGQPNLYDFEFQLVSRGSEVECDSHSTTFGIRSMELMQPEGAACDAEPWTFVINGNREFLRGANWAPMDAIPGRLRREDYAARLEQARAANVNFLRVWGGGLAEKQAFYDLCDEMGILVWQEFPFAGAVLDRFPTDSKFLGLVRAEARSIVQALRNHPSLSIWCGGNEFNTRGNRVIVEALCEIVEREDGTRNWKPASPYRDESHYWRVWHRKANLRDYQKTTTPFLSEFGLQSPPAADSLRRFLPENKLYPPNELWTYHDAEIAKLDRYAQSVEAQLDSLDEYVSASQRAQAAGIQIAVEHMRRRKGRASGVAVWQLDDAWPAISWSLIDYYGKPKLACAELQKLYSPVFASFDYPLKAYNTGETIRGDLWLVNDLLSTFDRVQVHAYLDDAEIYQKEFPAAADSAARVDSLEVHLGEGKGILRLDLRAGDQKLCDHTYDLKWSDRGEIKPWVAFAYSLYDRLMR